jgi:hypothetical protein
MTRSKASVLAPGLCVALLAAAVAGPAADADKPRLLVLDGSSLSEIRSYLQGEMVRGDAARILPSWSVLKRTADDGLSAAAFSVIDKSAVPPSGDKHDYMSQAPYWWPNPDTPNHLPYVRRDGEHNPDIDRISDHREMDRMTSAVETLALAAYLGKDERYAAKAAQLLRAWFVDPATRMNPHLQYAQAILGINDGRGIGIIESRGLTRVIDAIGLLETSAAWNPEDDRALREWFSRFLAWMRESRNGRDEAAAKNNHGTYYDAQVACYALFLDRMDIAREVLSAARERRIAAQIEPDGRQPLELARTRSWGYSVMNVDGLIQLATLGEHAGIDLWGYRTPDGRSIRAALLYLAPYAFGERKWPDQQITEWTPQALFPALRRAAARYRDEEFAAVAAKVPPLAAVDRANLTSAFRKPSAE